MPDSPSIYDFYSAAPYDPNTGTYDTSVGPIINLPDVAMPSSAAGSDPYSIGGILNGLGPALSGVSKIIAANNIGSVRPTYLRPPMAAAGVGMGTSGLSGLPMLLLLGAVAYFLFRRKVGA